MPYLNPTREQLAYLSSIGINIDSSPLKVKPYRLLPERPERNIKKVLFVLAFFILLFLCSFLFLFIKIACAGELPGSTVTASPAWQGDSAGLIFFLLSSIFFLLGRESLAGKVNCLITDFIYKSTVKREIPEPEGQGKIISGALESADFLKHKPVFFPSENLWGIGFGSVKGNVRDKNEDYGMVFKIADFDITVIADGCGGMPYGDRASYIATLAAVSYIISHLGGNNIKNLKNIASGAVFEASRRLSAEAIKLNIINGLRTTLIVIIASESKVLYSYIGDGGGWILRTSEGILEKFVIPHKGKSNNVLTSSLGPYMMGRPVTRMSKRNSCDIIITGTDGLFDRIEDFFIKDILKTCIYYKGDFTESIKFILNDLASYKDDAGYVFDDNITLSIIGNKIPEIPSSFWRDNKAKKDRR